ncbi:hypothetical protein Tcan_14113 [Toxocara canis]|uniref:Uncharacterized protein n=2 Tax=Toxocara canis TaxID=6265 RepID=A0A0B2V3G6_TOXCA|nr:hypothetical protein Tcan_14113 [Toxocara canis]VDM27825.1 unnamed protein product [Toxocara canis]
MTINNNTEEASSGEAETCSNFEPKKKHFRDTDAWKKKRSRLLTKMKAMGRFNLALMTARVPEEKEIFENPFIQSSACTSPTSKSYITMHIMAEILKICRL